MVCTRGTILTSLFLLIMPIASKLLACVHADVQGLLCPRVNNQELGRPYLVAEILIPGKSVSDPRKTVDRMDQLS